MAAFAIPLLAIGTGMKAVGAIASASAASSAAEFSQQIDEQNARLAIEQAKEDESRYRINAKRQISSISVAFAKGGISLRDGSALEVLQESHANLERDAQTIRKNGEIQAQGYRNDATYQGMRGRAAETEGILSAAGVLFGGVGDIYSRPSTSGINTPLKRA